MNSNITKYVMQAMKEGKRVVVVCANGDLASEVYYQTYNWMFGVKATMNQDARTVSLQNGGRLSVVKADNENAYRGQKFDMVVIPAELIGGALWERVIRPTMFDAQDGGVCLTS